MLHVVHSPTVTVSDLRTQCMHVGCSGVPARCYLLVNVLSIGQLAHLY